MAEFLSFNTLFPQIGLPQRPCLGRTRANLVKRQHLVLTLARHQKANDGVSLSSTSTSAREDAAIRSNALSNSRPVGTLLGRRRYQAQQPRRRQNNNGGHSSDEVSASEDAAFPRNATSPPLGFSRIKLDPSAHDISWDACTVRGFEDGSLIFKFDQLDPRVEEELSTAFSTSTSTDTSSTMDTTTSTLANFAWSNAMKLGVKFPQQLEITLRKLEEYLIEFNGKTAPARVELKHSLFRTYEKAVKRQEQLLLDEDIVSGIENLVEMENEETFGRVEENDDAEDKEESDSDASFTAVLEDLRSSIKNGSVNSQTQALVSSINEGEEEKQHEEESEHSVVATTEKGATSPSPSSVYILLKAFYRTMVFTPMRFLLSTLFSIVTWAVQLPLVLYRSLPYGFRKIFHSSWPPKVPTRHVSPSIHALFMDQSGFNRASLADAGFDAQGRCATPLSPLADVPVWQLEQLVGCGICDASVYRCALTHSTALPPEARALSYERLEYLGDAVLELITRQLLLQRAPDADEGELTNQGQFLVSGSTVNKYGAWMGLDKWVLCNAYSMRDGLVGSPHILGDAFEALLAAVYVDKGLEAARKLLIRVYNECPSVEWSKIGFMRDHKGELMKVAHQRRKPLPMYHVVSARPALYIADDAAAGIRGSSGTGIKRKYWNVEVEFDGEVIGSGSDFEKREAERQAAREALLYLGELDEEGSE